MKKKKLQRKVEDQKQRSFVQRWSPYEQKKQYTALEDPHANYYFCNKSVNKHLKNLKKVINHEKNEKEKAKLKEQITQKLSAVKLPNIKISPKTVIYANQINDSLTKQPSHFRKKSEHTIVSNHPDKNKQGEDRNQASFSVVEIKKYRKTHRESNKNNISASQPITEDMKSQSTKMANNNFSFSGKEDVNDVQKIHRESHAKFLDFLVQRKKKIEVAETSQAKSNIDQLQIKQGIQLKQ